MQSWPNIFKPNETSQKPQQFLITKLYKLSTMDFLLQKFTLNQENQCITIQQMIRLWNCIPNHAKSAISITYSVNCWGMHLTIENYRLVYLQKQRILVCLGAKTFFSGLQQEFKVWTKN